MFIYEVSLQGKVITHSNPNRIKEAIDSNSIMKRLVDGNCLKFSVQSREKLREYDAKVFSVNMKYGIFNNLKAFAKDLEDFERYQKLFGTLLDFFDVVWQRRDLKDENLLIDNTIKIKAVNMFSSITTVLYIFILFLIRSSIDYHLANC